MKIKWGNLLAFLLIVGGVVGALKWNAVKGFLSQFQKPASPISSVQRTAENPPPSPGGITYARDTWVTGGIPELGLVRGYQRDYHLTVNQAFYGSDQERLAAVGSGKAQFSEISWPSLLYNLEKVEKGKYQGQIAVLGFIDYSRGGDGLIVKSGIGTVNDLINKRVGYFNDGTGKYLLSFLLRMVDMRFEDVKGVPYDDEEALVRDFGGGKLDAIAYWQPGMNQVLKTVGGSRVLLSTADMPTLIPDVLIANRSYVDGHEQEAEDFLRFWFATVKHIQERPDMAYDRWAEALNKAVSPEGPIYGSDNTVAGLQEIFSKQVRLVGFDENLKLMGVTQPATIDQMVKFAVDNWNRLDSLKGPDVKLLVNNRPLAAIQDDVTLKVGAIDPSKSGTAAPVAEKPKDFKQNADPEKLDPVAQMAIPNIEFDPDATSITAAGKKVVTDVLAPLLKQFPNFYLLVDGHTDVGGDEATLVKLSQGRADSVKRELAAMGFPESQVITRGFGDKKPLFANPKNDTEKARNRRTEFRLLRDPLSQ